MNKPGNFSFIDSFIAGSAIPNTIEHLQYFEKMGINRVISLTSSRPSVMIHNNTSIYDHHLPIYSVPSEIIVNKYIDIIKTAIDIKDKVVVHCQFGQERTGIMLAIYLIEICGINAIDAIKKIHDMRPSSLRTYTAVNFLKERYNIL